MLHNSYVVLCLLAIFLTPISGDKYKVLVVCPFPLISHYKLCLSMVEQLTDRGHEVTYISAFHKKNAKFLDLSIPELMYMREKFMVPGYNAFTVNQITATNNMQNELMRAMFEDERMMYFISDKSRKYDVVIVDYILNEVLAGFGIKYDCPIIALSSLSLSPKLLSATSNPLSLATVPSTYTGFSSHMNLWERMINTGTVLMLEFFDRFILQPKQNYLYEKHFPEESKKVSFNDLGRHISSILVNTHPSLGVPRPLLPNTVEIGGYHINESMSDAEDLGEAMNESTNGMIYFSMGSNLKSSRMNSEYIRIFLKTFNNLEQSVLWKYEEGLPGNSKNVIIRSWMPQINILAHPNIKLFISHGGLLSCIEAAHFGVPMLIIPIFGDQFHNAKIVQERGNGIVLSYSNITEDSFNWAVKELLKNPKYGEEAKKLKTLYHDRPVKPQDLLVFQVEHVIRTNGAKHLTPPYLNRCSQLLLDVIIVTLLPLGILSSLLFFISWRHCCKKRKQTKINNRNKKVKTK